VGPAWAFPPGVRGFEYFEHTADVGVRAWGETVGDAFAAAAEGLVANMVDVEQAKPVGEARVELDADSPERLLHAFLEEVLFLFQTRGWVLTRAHVDLDGTRLTARLEGEAYDAKRHGHIHEVKAITFHDMTVQREPPEVRVILDI
jgi:SHS2 domain-containing protein